MPVQPVSPVIPTAYSAAADTKAMNEFVPWMKKSVKFRSSGRRAVDKYMEGVLNRWAVMSREVGQRALSYPAVMYDSTKRLVLVEATVVLTNKSGGYLLDAWLEDKEKRRYDPKEPYFQSYWGRLYQFKYSEVDRYFVEPICGSTLSKYLYKPTLLIMSRGTTTLSPVVISRAVSSVSLKGGQKLRAGLGFYVPDGASNLVLHITSKLKISQTVLGGGHTGTRGRFRRPDSDSQSGVKEKEINESIQLKVGSLPSS
jgi:hypothetical protein